TTHLCLPKAITRSSPRAPAPDRLPSERRKRLIPFKSVRIPFSLDKANGFELFTSNTFSQGDRCAVFASPVKKNTRQPGAAASVTVLPWVTNLHSAASSAGGSRQRSSSLKSATCRWPAAFSYDHCRRWRSGRTTKVDPAGSGPAACRSSSVPHGRPHGGGGGRCTL